MRQGDNENANKETEMRKINKNIYGNWVGYVGKKRVEEFRDCEVSANYWMKTGDAEWHTNAWL